MPSQTSTGGLICRPGLPFGLPAGYQPEDFIYGNDGPWPCQPSDDDACRGAPEVLLRGRNSIPQSEHSEWKKYVANYYLDNSLVFTTRAIEYSADILNIKLDTSREIEIAVDIGFWLESGFPIGTELFPEKGQYPALSDSSFTDLIAHGLLSKLMSKLDPPDETLLQNLLTDSTREFWKCDLTHMRVVRAPLDGEYVAPSIVYLSRPQTPAPGQEYDFRVEAIRIFAQTQQGGPYDHGALLTSGDGKAWQLAKYFALQGALVRINLIDHPMVHFPFDAINAITKSVLPKSNRILQLLLPHLFLSLPVDNAVLKGDYSLLNRTWNYPYSPYPAAGDEIRKVFPFYWWGSEFASDAVEPWASGRDNAFPPYQFRTEPRAIPSKYGTFLNTYYVPILDFTKGVVGSIPDDSADWEAIRFWADHVASWIPGFPNGPAIYKNRELLAKTCASIIWNGSIVHTADHWLMHQMFEQKIPTPYILRDRPPVAPSPGVDPAFRPTVRLVRDVIPARLCDLMFFLPHGTTLLNEFKYPFENDLGPTVQKFKNDMIATDKQLHQMFPAFGIRLYPEVNQNPANDCFAAGVQF